MATTTSKAAPDKAGTADGKGADGKDADGAKKKSKKKLVIVAALVLLLGGGGYVMMGKKKSGPPPPPEPGAVVALDAITVNLAGGHFLKLGLALQAVAGGKEEPNGSKALDIAIDEFSDKSITDLSSAAARTRYKADLRKKVIKAYDGGKVIMDVYFTEFVMQ